MMNSTRLLLALSLGIFLVGLEVSVEALTVSLLFLAWKAAIEIWKLQKPPRWLTNSLTLLFFALILVKYRSIAGQEASSSFLILLTSLKLLEERTLRDQKFLFLLGFVVIAALLLFSLEVPALVGSLAVFTLLWSAQQTQIKYSKVFLKSLPLALFLFLFFPRVQNPFGLRTYASGQGTVGFSDELSPGSIANLQSTKELAFRVQFFGNKKLRIADQYWRGQVLNLSEGLSWKKTPAQILERSFPRFANPDYEVTLEPQQKRWIFVWEPTQRIQSDRLFFVLKKGPYFESVAPIYERTTYQGQIGTLATQEEEASRLGLQVPEVPNSVAELAQKFREPSKSRQQIAEEILNYFQTQGFLYTKSPGTNSNNLENFLFKNKKGYCEHYAAATATLLRLAQVPARVVTGYQGGEYNSYGNFWRFSQSDAHAWVEFLNDAGTWQRIDPTGVVAPERIELGGLLFQDLPEEWIGQNRAQDYLKIREAWWPRTRDLVLQNLESWNYELVLFLLDFNLEKQKELFREYRYWAVALGFLLLLPFVVQSASRRRRTSFAQWLLKNLEQQARQQNLHRENSETLRSFVGRWQKQNPTQAAALAELLTVYESEEYREKTPGFSVKEVKRLLKGLGK